MTNDTTNKEISWRTWKNVLGSSLMIIGGGALALFFIFFIVGGITDLWSTATSDDPLWSRIIEVVFRFILILLVFVACAIAAGIAGISFGLSILVAIGLAFTMPWPGAWEIFGYFLLFLLVAGGMVGPGYILRDSHQDDLRFWGEQKAASRRKQIFGSQSPWANRFGDKQGELESKGRFTRHAENFQEYGIPGEGLLSAIDTHMGRGAALSGAAGEKKTAEIVRSLSEDFPGITLFNGLKVKDDEGWDIDHAIVFADLVVYVDSKHYTAADYAWVGKCIEQYPTSSKPGRANYLGEATETISTDLRSGITVKSAVVVHSTNDGQPINIIGDPEPDNRPRLMNTQDFTTWIKKLLQEHHPGGEGPLRGVSAYIHHCTVESLSKRLPQYIRDRGAT